MIWSVDRFGRSMAGNVADIKRLTDAGVAVVSVKEPLLDTSVRSVTCSSQS